MLYKIVVSLILIVVQGCYHAKDVTVLTDEKSRAVMAEKFGTIEQLEIVSGKTIKTYTSNETNVTFRLSGELAPVDWISFLVKRYTDLQSGISGFQPFYAVNQYQYKNDINGTGSDIVTISYSEASGTFEYNSYIYY